MVCESDRGLHCPGLLRGVRNLMWWRRRWRVSRRLCTSAARLHPRLLSTPRDHSTFRRRGSSSSRNPSERRCFQRKLGWVSLTASATANRAVDWLWIPLVIEIPFVTPHSVESSWSARVLGVLAVIAVPLPRVAVVWLAGSADTSLLGGWAGPVGRFLCRRGRLVTMPEFMPWLGGRPRVLRLCWK